MAEDNKIKLLAVVGATASGKSALALSLAQRFDGEIVSCDSMQVYRRMDIGTAKPMAEEMQGITLGVRRWGTPRCITSSTGVGSPISALVRLVTWRAI